MVSMTLLDRSDGGDGYGMRYELYMKGLTQAMRAIELLEREVIIILITIYLQSAYQNKPLPGLDFESAIADPDFFDKYLFPGELPIEVEHQSSIPEIDFCLSLFLSEFGSFHSASPLSVYEKLLSFPIPTIASVGGHGFAAGFGLAMAHDFRVMNGNRGYLCMNEIE